MDQGILLETLNGIVPNLVLLVLGANVVLCALSWNRMNRAFKYLSYYVFWNFLIEVAALAFIQLGFNNLPLLHLYTVGEFVFFSLFYMIVLGRLLVFRRWMPYAIGIGVTLIVFNSIFLQSIYGFNTFAKSAVQIVIIGYSVLFFYHVMEEKKEHGANTKSLRLINAAIMIYYSGSLFVFMYGFSIDLSETYLLFWAFNAILNLVFQLLIFCSIWMAYFRKRTF